MHTIGLCFSLCFNTRPGPWTLVLRNLEAICETHWSLAKPICSAGCCTQRKEMLSGSRFPGDDVMLQECRVRIRQRNVTEELYRVWLCSPASSTQSQQNRSYHVQGPPPPPDPSSGCWGVRGCAFNCLTNGFGGDYWHLIGGGQGCYMSRNARKIPILGKLCAAQNANDDSPGWLAQLEWLYWCPNTQRLQVRTSVRAHTRINQWIHK